MKLRNLYVNGGGTRDLDYSLWPGIGILVRSLSGEKYGNIEIFNCTVEGHDAGIALSGAPAEINSCTVHDSVGSLISIGGGEREDIVKLINNKLYNQVDPPNCDQHGSGFAIWATSVHIENNVVYNAGGTSSLTFYDTGFPYTNMIVTNNLIYSSVNAATARFYSLGNNVQIINNMFIGWKDTGLDQDDVRRYGNAYGLNLYDSNVDTSTIKIYNNVGVGRGVLPEGCQEGGNIFWSVENFDGSWLSNEDRNSLILSDQSGMTAGYNTDFFEGSLRFFIGGPDFDEHAFEHGDLYYDVANLTDEYRLAPGSPAIGFADPAHAPATDILGNLRDDEPDAGAYEYIASTFLYGDVNGNGEVTSYDAALTARYAVGLETFTDEQKQKADVSGNGEVSAYDAALIAQRAVGLIEGFPIEEDLPSFSFTEIWNFLKSLLTRETGKAILTGKAVLTGNAVDETGEDSKVPYVILSVFVVIMLIIFVIIVKIRKTKK